MVARKRPWDEEDWLKHSPHARPMWQISGEILRSEKLGFDVPLEFRTLI
jgi:hypothetical protein